MEISNENMHFYIRALRVKYQSTKSNNVKSWIQSLSLYIFVRCLYLWGGGGGGVGGNWNDLLLPHKTD